MATRPEPTRSTHLRLVKSVNATKVERSDDELIDGVIAGNAAIASELYDRLIGVVDATLVRLFGRRESDHEDLVQITFEQILRTLIDRKYARACKLTTWASTIASHVGMNALRARKTERRFVDRETQVDDAPTRAAHPDRAHEARSEVARLRSELVQMDPVKAEAVILHDMLGHELAEIAVLTNVSVAAAQSRLVRGRRELFERLGKTTPEAPRRIP